MALNVEASAAAAAVVGRMHLNRYYGTIEVEPYTRKGASLAMIRAPDSGSRE